MMRKAGWQHGNGVPLDKWDARRASDDTEIALSRLGAPPMTAAARTAPSSPAPPSVPGVNKSI
jgi:hypothetical protein